MEFGYVVLPPLLTRPAQFSSCPLTHTVHTPAPAVRLLIVCPGTGAACTLQTM